MKLLLDLPTLALASIFLFATLPAAAACSCLGLGLRFRRDWVAALDDVMAGRVPE